jgi:hypothetical protein
MVSASGNLHLHINVWRIILDAMLKCLQLLVQERIYSALKCKEWYYVSVTNIIKIYPCAFPNKNTKWKLYVLSWMGHRTMMPELLNLNSFNTGEQYTEILVQNSPCVFTPSAVQQLSRFSRPLFNTRPTWPSSGVLNCPNCYTAFNSVQFTLAVLL